ncbi:MAG: ATP-binding protein [Bdellovibrio sp.]|nr:ATP-binding protein [Bdellovibrio sp.]
MKIKSLIQNRNRLEIAEVEIEFIPGIPQIHFLGLPDRLIKESFYRIKSALKNSGYQFPVTSQMIVNIKPNHLRKSSRGVELAVAIGLLLKTEQIPAKAVHDDWIVYGELGLDGHVYEPTDLANELPYFKNQIFLSGRADIQAQSPSNVMLRVRQLKDFEIITEKKSEQRKYFQRPQAGLEKFFSKDEAEFLFLSAASGLHGLLAGDSGAGKSTLARSLLSFLKEPTEQQAGRWDKQWRPLIAPHQSITPAAFLGGGQNLYEGEIERVQGGVLLMDEFLEFDPEILESLRGPMTGETLRLARGADQREIASEFQVIATTNLCPCGKWTPVKKNVSCRFTRTKCARTLEKLSGPILDRFGILFFTAPVMDRTIKGLDVLKRIEKFKLKQSRVVIQKSDEVVKDFYSQLSSRRRSYLERIASIYATEKAAENLDPQKALQLSFGDYNQAERWVIKPFEQLEKGMN